MEFERTHAATMVNEKGGKYFNKVIGEWKEKVDDLVAELDACNSECHNFTSERLRLKVALDESGKQLDTVCRKNKNHSE